MLGAECPNARWTVTTSAGAWAAAFSEFRAAREAWAEDHEGVVLEQYEVNGYCPVDYSRFCKSTG